MKVTAELADLSVQDLTRAEPRSLLDVVEPGIRSMLHVEFETFPPGVEHWGSALVVRMETAFSESIMSAGASPFASGRARTNTLSRSARSCVAFGSSVGLTGISEKRRRRAEESEASEPCEKRPKSSDSSMSSIDMLARSVSVCC